MPGWHTAPPACEHGKRLFPASVRAGVTPATHPPSNCQAVSPVADKPRYGVCKSGGVRSRRLQVKSSGPCRQSGSMDRSESGEGVQHLIMRQAGYAVRGIVFVCSDFNAINGDVNGGNHTTHMVDVAFKSGGVFLASTDGNATVAGDFTFHRQLIAGSVSNGVVNAAFSSASTS